MRSTVHFGVGLLVCLSVGAITSAIADPPTKAPATPATQAAAGAPAAPTASPAPASAKAPFDKDTQHFLAAGYKPEMHGGEMVYRRKDPALGSRLAQVKSCGTIEQLKLAEQKTQSGISDAQRQQSIGPSR
jgi:hypothetical protein